MGKLYVGNLSEKTTGPELERLFAPYGKVKWADVAVDPATKKPKGFGFVQMDSEDEAKRAVAALNGKGHEGQLLKVSQSAKPKKGPPGRRPPGARPMRRGSGRSERRPGAGFQPRRRT